MNPSLSQKCSKLTLVTKFPVQLCAISWAMTNVRERSPAYIKVKNKLTLRLKDPVMQKLLGFSGERKKTDKFDFTEKAVFF